MFVARYGAALGETGGGEHLNAVADGEDAFVLSREFAHQGKQAGVVAQVLRSASAQNQDSGKIARRDGRDGDIGFDAVAGTFDVSLPARFGVMQDHVQAPPGRGRNDGCPLRFQETLASVQRLVAIAPISRDNQNLSAHRRLRFLGQGYRRWIRPPLTSGRTSRRGGYALL